MSRERVIRVPSVNFGISLRSMSSRRVLRAFLKGGQYTKKQDQLNYIEAMQIMCRIYIQYLLEDETLPEVTLGSLTVEFTTESVHADEDIVLGLDQVIEI